MDATCIGIARDMKSKKNNIINMEFTQFELELIRYAMDDLIDTVGTGDIKLQCQQIITKIEQYEKK